MAAGDLWLAGTLPMRGRGCMKYRSQDDGATWSFRGITGIRDGQTSVLIGIAVAPNGDLWLLPGPLPDPT